MDRALLIVLLVVALVGLGCSRGQRSPVESPAGDALAPLTIVPRDPSTTGSLLARFELQIDPESLSAILAPARDAAATQGLQYDTDLGLFAENTLSVVGVELDSDNDVVVTFRHAHPLPAPDIEAPPSATNRADLGYTGRLLILADREEYQFFEGEVVLDPTLVVAPDGYVEPRALLTIEQNNTAFPYMLLVDEGKDTREGVSNYNQWRGNYEPAEGGWSPRQLDDPEEDHGWLGYDYLHAGQATRIAVTFDDQVVRNNPVPIELAILIQYTDPRGAPGVAHRLPPENDNDPALFAYRLPHAALDVSQLKAPQLERIWPPEWILDFSVGVRDWDVLAPQFLGMIGDAPNLGAVLQGTAGLPRVEFQAPTLLGETVHSLTYGSSYDSGLSHSFRLELATGSEVPPTPRHWGIVRVTDPEASVNPGRFGIDPLTRAPDPAFALRPTRTYQVIAFEKLRELPPIREIIGADAVAEFGETVTFEAVMERPATTFDREFFRNSNRPSHVTAARAYVAMDRVGFFEGHVFASDPPGTSVPEFHSQVFTYSVMPRAGAPSVRGRIEPGCTGDVVAAEVTESSGNPVQITWDTGGAGTPATATGTNPQFTLGEPGHYRVTVHGSNASGPGAADHLGYIVAETTPVCWTQSFVKASPAGRFAALGALDWNGRPAVIYARYRDDGAMMLYLNRALTPNPLRMADWVESELYANVNRYKVTKPVLIDGMLAVVMVDLFNTPYFVRSLTAEPTGPADWSATILPFAGSGWGLTVHQGHPVAAASFFMGNYEFLERVAEARVPWPTGPGDWQTTTLDVGDFYASTSTLASNPDALLMSLSLGEENGYGFAVRVADSAEPWSLYTMPGDREYASANLAVSNGRFLHVPPVSGDTQLSRATVAIPASPDNWEALAVPFPPGTDGIRHILEVEGRLALTTFEYSSRTLSMVRALVPWPSTQTDWVSQEILDIRRDDPEAWPGYETISELLVADGRLMVLLQRSDRSALIAAHAQEAY